MQLLRTTRNDRRVGPGRFALEDRVIAYIDATEVIVSAAIDDLVLNNSVTMPAIGLGVFQSSPEETAAAVEAALKTGYRHIDTAAAYLNERQVGEGIRRSGVNGPRSSLRPRFGSATTATTRRCTPSRRPAASSGSISWTY